MEDGIRLSTKLRIKLRIGAINMTKAKRKAERNLSVLLFTE